MAAVAAVVVAAGEGRRLGAAEPKALVLLAGRPLLLHSLERLAGIPGLVEQVVVVPPGWRERLAERFAPEFARWRVAAVVDGGARRQDSAAAGFAALSPGVEVVLVHDAARPLVRPADAARVAEAAARDGAALLAVPLSDTLKREREGMRVGATLERGGLWRAQTPQGFRREVYAAALARAMKEGGEATDDASLVERDGGAVTLVEGDSGNLKITTAADLRIAEAILREEEGR